MRTNRTFAKLAPCWSYLKRRNEASDEIVSLAWQMMPLYKFDMNNEIQFQFNIHTSILGWLCY